MNGFHTESTNDLFENHLFVPVLGNYFFGEGVWPLAEPNYRYFSDSGFVLSYIYLGVIGVVLSVVMLFVFLKIYYNTFSISINGSINRVVLITLLFFFIFFFILKAPLFFSEKFMSSLIVTNIVYEYFEKVS
jgi:hypothetical protein